jgi:hypothetical protein
MKEQLELTFDFFSVRRGQHVTLAILPLTFIAFLVFLLHSQSTSTNIGGFPSIPGIHQFGAVGDNSITGIITRAALPKLPRSSVLTPEDGQTITGTIYIITGTASSDHKDVQKVEISIDHGDWDLAEGISPWVYTWTLPSSDGSFYNIRSMATDIQSRQEIPGNGITATVDNVSPTCGITRPLTNGEVISGTEYRIEGWASDSFGVRQVEVTTDNGSSWDIADGTDIWSYTLPLGSNCYTIPIGIKTTDLVGNVNPLCAERDVVVLNLNYIYLPLIMRDPCSYYCGPVIPFNGGFETGDFTYWTHGGELAQAVQSEVACECNYAALLGNPDYNCEKGVPVGRAWMQQTFTVPSTGSSVLSFCYRIMTHDHIKWTNGTTLGDSFDVYVQDNLVLRDGYDNYPYPSPGCGSLQDLGWRYFSHDLTSYIGQDVQVRFENWNRHDGWYNTLTYVDKVRVVSQ